MKSFTQDGLPGNGRPEWGREWAQGQEVLQRHCSRLWFHYARSELVAAACICFLEAKLGADKCGGFSRPWQQPCRDGIKPLSGRERDGKPSTLGASCKHTARRSALQRELPQLQ